jgi:hypothetical protein
VNGPLATHFRAFVEAAASFVMTSRRARGYHFGRVTQMLRILEALMMEQRPITVSNFETLGIEFMTGFVSRFDDYFEDGTFPVELAREGQF